VVYPSLDFSADRTLGRSRLLNYALSLFGEANFVVVGFIRKWQGKLQQIRDALEASRMFLVTTAEDFALSESLRCIRQLEAADPPMRLSGIVLNRIIQNPGSCARCLENAKAADKARRRLRERYLRSSLGCGRRPLQHSRRA